MILALYPSLEGRANECRKCADCATCTGVPDEFRFYHPPQCLGNAPLKGTFIPNCPKKKRKYTVRAKKKSYSIVDEYYCVEKPRKIVPCPPFCPDTIVCKIVNPADIQDNTCAEFPQMLKTCQPYTCMAPNSQDPTVRTWWKIHKKIGNRCVVSNTTDTIGIKDEDEQPLPVTQICEYDKIGVQALLVRFADLNREYFHYSTCAHFRGVHNCSFHIRDKVIRSIKDVRKPPY